MITLVKDTIDNKDIDNLISSGYITDKQKEQIILYYFNNNTLAQIGKKFSISREAVRQNIKRAFVLGIRCEIKC